MNTLTYMEYNGTPVISARNLYAFLTSGTGEQVGAWIAFCSGHHLLTMGEDMFKVTSDGGHVDILLTPTSASAVCVAFRNDRAKQAYMQIRDMIDYKEVVPEFDVNDDTVITVNEAAKIVNLKHGPNELFKVLRESKIINKRNIPMQSYVEEGYFKVISSKFHRLDGKILHYAKTMVTPKGLKYIMDLIMKREILQQGAA